MKLYRCSTSGHRRARAAFTLVEVVLALGIMVFVGMGIVGLFIIAVRMSNESWETTNAANVATLLVNQRRITPVDATNAAPGTGMHQFALPDLSVSRSNFNFISATVTTPVYVDQDGYKTTLDKARYGLLYTITRQPRTADLYMVIYSPAAAAPTNALVRYELVTELALP